MSVILESGFVMNESTASPTVNNGEVLLPKAARIKNKIFMKVMMTTVIATCETISNLQLSSVREL